MIRHTMIPAVHMFFVNEKGEYLFSKRKNTGYRDGWYSLPAGHVERLETPTQAAIREVKEEVGVEVTADQLEFVHVLHRYVSDRDEERIDFFFVIREWEGEPHNAEPDVCDGLVWKQPEDRPEKIIPYIDTALNCVLQGQRFSEVKE